MSKKFKYNPPSFDLFADDWLGSKNITLMPPAAEGGYIRLLCHAWNSPDCGLDNDPTSLAKLSRLGKRWGKMSNLVLKTWTTRRGRLYHPKLLEQRREADKRIHSKVLAGKASGKARNARSTPVQHPLNDPLPLPLPSITTTTTTKPPSVSKPKPRKRKKHPYTLEFESWWKPGPRTGTKFEAFAEWRLLNPDEIMREDFHDAIENQTRWRQAWASVDKQHCPSWKHMCRWLKTESWDLELDWPPSYGSGQSNLEGSVF